MIEPADDEDAKAIVRRAGATMMEMLGKQQTLILDEHSAMARWLTASLLAVNGAAALAVFNAAERLSRPSLDGLPFVAGVFAALASGVLNQWANQAGGKVLGEAVAQAFVIAETGEYTDDQQRMAETVDIRLRSAGRWPILAGWVSAILFGAGAITTGADQPPRDPATSNRCLAIQHDMLSARPRRQDSPALFQALGCPPQGEGSVHAVPQPAPAIR